MGGLQGINGVGGPARIAPRGTTRRVDGQNFTLPEDAAEAPAAMSAVTMPSLLGLQEAEQGVVQDRAARRHGTEMLDALRDLQLGLLGTGAGDVSARLESLVRMAPEAVDPRLAAVQRALMVRAAVERARAEA